MSTRQGHVMRGGAVGRVALGGLMLSGALVAPRAAPLAGQRATPLAAWAQAWPMVGHDPQRTNRSASTGPLHPRLLFAVASLTRPALIGADGGIYASSYNPRTQTDGVTALTATGRWRWTAPLSRLEGGPPALAPDGAVLMNGHDSTGEVIAAIAPTGQRRWTIRSLSWATGLRETPHSKEEPPLVTGAGLFYVPLVGPEFRAGDNVGLQIVSPGGTPLRVLQRGLIPHAVALAGDSTVYELAARCCMNNVSLLALNATGALRWAKTLAFAPTYVTTGLLVGMRGTIYASDSAGIGAGNAGEVVAYTPAGRRLWRLRTTDGAATLAERADGSVLVATTTHLSAFTAGGTQIWRRALGHPTGLAAALPTLPSLAVDAAGHAYVGSSDGVVRAIGPAGVSLWTLGVPNAHGSPSIALGPDGHLVIVSDALRVYQ